MFLNICQQWRSTSLHLVHISRGHQQCWNDHKCGGKWCVFKCGRNCWCCLWWRRCRCLRCLRRWDLILWRKNYISLKTKHFPGIKAVGNGVSGGIKAVGKGSFNISFQMIISCTNVPPFSRRIEFLIENHIYFHFPGVSGGIRAVNDGVVGTIDGVKHGVTGGISRWAF